MADTTFPGSLSSTSSQNNLYNWMYVSAHINHLELRNLPTLWINGNPAGAVQISCNQCLPERAIKVGHFNSLKDEIRIVNLLTFPFNGQSVNLPQVVSYDDLFYQWSRLISKQNKNVSTLFPHTLCKGKTINRKNSCRLPKLLLDILHWKRQQKGILTPPQIYFK